MILYIHGFLSSSKSTKAQQLKTWLQQQGRAEEFICPDLSPHPTQAMATLTQIVENAEQPLKLVGSSLGGFYATCLSERYDLKAVVINPSTNPAVTLTSRIGKHKAWHSEEMVEFTHDDVQALQAMRYDNLTKPNNFLLMVEKADETLDYQKALQYYADCNQLIFNHGNHSFSRFLQVLHLVDSF
ncbi:MAG: esterase [Moraxellaceae bacterium]|nr:esterase [Moraxellaceae bacterium]